MKEKVLQQKYLYTFWSTNPLIVALSAMSLQQRPLIWRPFEGMQNASKAGSGNEFLQLDKKHTSYNNKNLIYYVFMLTYLQFLYCLEDIQREVRN